MNETMAMKYWAINTDEGIVIRAAESLDQLQRPEEWREVENIHAHANGKGVDALNAGKRMVFTQIDQSFPRLLSLFA